MNADDLKRYTRMLELRQLLSKASTAKFTAYLDRIQDDDRIRSTLLYHGAGTGRWTAKGVQLQNLPSRGLLLDPETLGDNFTPAIEQANKVARDGWTDTMYANPIGIAQSCIRSMIIPAEGHRFMCADYSAIEGRGLAWLAGEDSVIDAYKTNKRMYCVAAAGIYGVPYEDIYKGRKTDKSYKKMDQVGKVVELACGYQGAVNAFRKMERSQGMHLGMTDAEIALNIKGWRESRPMTVKLWRGLEDAAMEAVQNPGTIATYRAIKFMVTGKFLMMKLPSGRRLYYYDPKVESKLMPWADYETGGPCYKDCVSFWGVDAKTKKWSKQWGYGGLWAENAVQGLSRDVMARAMLRLDAAGYKPVLTVHDEILVEILKAFGSVEEFVALMTVLEPWMAGFPISAEGFTCDFYRK